MKLLLTSAGLENEVVEKYFLDMLEKEIKNVKALFIPTAAIDVGAIQVLPKCINDLLRCGIEEQNITIYDLHDLMDVEQLKQYDAIYICGGNTAYLLERMNENNFSQELLKFIYNDGIVIGVSAGSIIFASNLGDNLGIVESRINVHCENGEQNKKLTRPFKEEINLTNQQALVVKSKDEQWIIG